MNAKYLCVVSISASALLFAGGCVPTGLEENAKQAPSTVDGAVNGVVASSPDGSVTNAGAGAAEGEHGHIPGAHGGILISLGRDSYHVEAVIDSEGQVRLYTLGKDESRVIEIESQSLRGFVKGEGDSESKSISFEPSPQEGDSQGKTSLFLGQLPKELLGRRLDLTIPNIRIDSERFRLGFVSGPESHGGSSDMPTKVASEAERTLYLTPGGRYTAADIEANGNMTASQKFKGVKSEHDMKPNVGDKLCPISGTKANPKFTWIIEGKSYQFCCPPCVDEFLSSAKLSAEPLPDPDSFIKK